MADNIILNGETLAFDEVVFNGVNVKAGWGKLAYGGLDAFVPVTDTSGLPVVVKNASLVLGAGSAAIGAVTISNAVGVTGTFWQTTQPVSIAALPALSAGSAAIGTVVVTSLPALPTGTNSIGAVTQGGTWNVGITGNAAITAASLPLPTGAATSTAQTTGNTSLASIDTKTPALVSGKVPVDGSGTTQPISAAALPLPTGAATDAGLGNVLAALQVVPTALPPKPFNLPGACLKSNVRTTTAGSKVGVAAIATKLIGIYGIMWSVSAACSVEFFSNTTSLGVLDYPSGGIFVLDVQEEPWFTAAAGEAFNYTVTGVSTISGKLYYRTN